VLRGPSIKMSAVRGKAVVQCGHFTDKGVFRCRLPHFLMQKTSDFMKFMVGPHGLGGVQPVRTFCGREGGGVNFSPFCVNVLYGRPLIVIGQGT